jgi:hypothetical protein
MNRFFVTSDIRKEKIINKKPCFFQLCFPFRSRFQQYSFIKSHVTFTGPVDVSDKSILPCNSGSGTDILTVANTAISQVEGVYNAVL